LARFLLCASIGLVVDEKNRQISIVCEGAASADRASMQVWLAGLHATGLFEILTPATNRWGAEE
jgi:hypothetical protein